ncbi:MAG: anthranilate phosphoribosyltransferase family protein [Cyanophyceae cyanobacterium]
MSEIFRDYLKKVGSGRHTRRSLTRAEAADAARLMLTGVATPAQIGAFLIAHRIARPLPEELAGFLDAYDELGPAIAPIATDHPVMTFGIPYDGRSRTVPLGIATALVLASAGQPVLLHGGDRVATKYGLPLVELWRALGVDWRLQDLAATRTTLETCGVGFMYLRRDFPLAQGLMGYRDDIGKRPPLATLELMWSPYQGRQRILCGFVHPPTEVMMREAFALRGTVDFVTIKGLEGSCDAPRERTVIGGINRPVDGSEQFERLRLSARSLGIEGPDLPLEDTATLAAALRAALGGEPGPLADAIAWNGGLYLWLAERAESVEGGIAQARSLLAEGAPAALLQRLRAEVGSAIAEPVKLS